MRNTIQDVAAEAGVSITTVSRVINGNYPVKKETLEKVEEVIKKLNYRPNPLARGLINRKTNSIGVVVPGITNMFFTEVVYGIEKFIKNHGYDILLSNTEGLPESEVLCVKKFMDKLVDGIIVLDPQTENMKNGFYEEVSKAIPIICVNGYHKGINTNFIISNEENGTREALQHLITLGHKNIAFVRSARSYSYDLKETIYKEYINKIGGTPIIINTEDGNSIDVVEDTSRKIVEFHQNNIPFGSNISAVFACNDLMALGVLNGLLELNLKVPQDVSIIGFDNIILSQMTKPKITTVDQNMRLLGEKSATNIISLIEKKSLRCDNLYIETSLIIRETCDINKAYEKK